MSDHDPHGEGHGADADGWCSVNEAARRLSVTPTAIRNRIKRRTLETKPNGNHGRLVWVPRPVPRTVALPVPPTVSDTVPGTGSRTATNTVSGTVPVTDDPLVTELRDRIGELQTRLGAAQEELVAMARNLGAAQGEIAAMQAQAADIRADRDAWRQQAEHLATPTLRQPWWRKWPPEASRPWWRRIAG